MQTYSIDMQEIVKQIIKIHLQVYYMFLNLQTILNTKKRILHLIEEQVALENSLNVEEQQKADDITVSISGVEKLLEGVVYSYLALAEF